MLFPLFLDRSRDWDNLFCDSETLDPEEEPLTGVLECI